MIIGKDLPGSGPGPMEIMSLYLTGWTEEDHGEPEVRRCPG
jgi:hypothetical protein